MQGAEQHRREHYAHRAAEAEQGDRDRVESRGVAEVLVGEVVVDTGDLNCTGQAREGAGDQHRDDDGPPHAHARVAGRFLALAGGADLIPEGSPPQENREHRHSDHSDDESDVHAVDACRQPEDLDRVAVGQEGGETCTLADGQRLRSPRTQLEGTADD